MVKLFAPGTGAAVVLLVLAVATAGGAVDDDGGAVWAKTDPVLTMPSTTAPERILFISVLVFC
jgi:hypothetical protein